MPPNNGYLPVSQTVSQTGGNDMEHPETTSSQSIPPELRKKPVMGMLSIASAIMPLLLWT